MLSDRVNLLIFRQELNKLQPPGEVNYSLVGHRMGDSIKGAINVIKDYYDDLINNMLPDHYKLIDEIDIPNISKQNNIYFQELYGNSRRTFLVTALKYIEKHALGKKFFAETTNIELSAIIDKVKLPLNLNIQALQATSLYDNNSDSFVLTHSGYNISDGYNDKKNSPEDCSSFVSKIFGVKYPFKTVDQLEAYNHLQNHQTNLLSEQAKEIVNNFGSYGKRVGKVA